MNVSVSVTLSQADLHKLRCKTTRWHARVISVGVILSKNAFLHDFLSTLLLKEEEDVVVEGTEKEGTVEKGIGLEEVMSKIEKSKKKESKPRKKTEKKRRNAKNGQEVGQEDEDGDGAKDVEKHVEKPVRKAVHC